MSMRLTSPVVTKELRTWLRTRRAFAALLVLLLVLGGALLLTWSLRIQMLSVQNRAQFARAGFMVLAGCQLALLGFISPLLTATAITREREAHTLELLFCTGISRWHLLFGKWASAIGYQLLLSIALLPVYALTFMLGGVGGDEVALAATLTATTMATYSMIGLACSAWMRRSISATMLTLVLVLGWFFAILLTLRIGAMFMLPVRTPGYLPALISIGSPLTILVRLGIGGQAGLPSVPNWYVNPAVWLHLAFQAALFVVAALLAWRGLVRREVMKPVIARKVIDDPRELKRRRDQWPYYLIDPQARAQLIPDGRNPIYLKEIRVGGLARPAMLIRLGYVGLFFSLPLMLAMLSGDMHSEITQVFGLLIFLFALAIPLMAAPLISRERVEGTMPLLITSLVSPRRIVWAKFLAACRFFGALLASLLILPTIIFLGVLVFHGKLSEDFLVLLRYAAIVAMFTAFYIALSLFCSSHCRHNAFALVLAYGLIACATFGPHILPGVFEVLEQLDILDFAHNSLYWLKFLSPFVYLESVYQWGSRARELPPLGGLITRLLGLGLVTGALLLAAARRLARESGRRAARGRLSAEA